MKEFKNSKRDLNCNLSPGNASKVNGKVIDLPTNECLLMLVADICRQKSFPKSSKQQTDFKVLSIHGGSLGTR